MFRLFECCALSFFERFVLSFSLKIERFVSDSAEIWICGLYLDMPQFEPQYMLVVDRKNNLDSLQVQVEVRKDFFSDDMGSMLAMKKALSDKLKSVLSISAEVKLMEPNSIARSEGKSKRVIDNRILK